jgi:hypothetical protein
MAPITAEGFQVCMAFGTASLAVVETAELIARSNPASPTTDLFVELKAAHSRLRILFAQGFDDEVLVLQRTSWNLQSESLMRSRGKNNELACEQVSFHFLYGLLVTPAGLPAAPAGAAHQCSASTGISEERETKPCVRTCFTKIKNCGHLCRPRRSWSEEGSTW